MAVTGTFGGFYFDPEVFAEYMQEQPTWRNEVINSSIVAEDQSIMDMVGAKGSIFTMPMYTPPSVATLAALNNDGATNNTPSAITSKKQTGMMIQRMQAWKEQDFTKALTGADPIANVGNYVADYYQQVWQNEMMNIAQAVMGISALSSHVKDISTTTGTITDANKIAADTMIDAEAAALGDASVKNGMGLVVMHSMVYAKYLKLGLITFGQYDGMGALEKPLNLPTLNGKIVIVTDRNTVSSVTVNSIATTQYQTYLFGEGAFLSCDKTNYPNPYVTFTDYETTGGVEKLYTQQGKVLHPNGVSLVAANIAKDSPTTTELGTAANYTLVADPKNVRIGVIKSN